MATSPQTVAVTDLQRSTKKVLENLRSYALIQSHGRTKAVLLTAELGERLLASGHLEALQEIPTDDRETERPVASTALEHATDLSTLARVVGPVLSALAR
jgi:hypothetical protein